MRVIYTAQNPEFLPKPNSEELKEIDFEWNRELYEAALKAVMEQPDTPLKKIS
jgi:hypothetical protein